MSHLDSGKEIPSNFPAPFLDKTQYAISDVFVLQIHLRLKFDEKLSPERFKRALRLALDAEPVLGCRFDVRPIKPVWARMSPDDLDRVDLLSVITGDDLSLDAAAAAFLAAPLDEEMGPQLKAVLLQRESGDEVLIKVNHQNADAGGAKELGYLIADLYSRLEKYPDFAPIPNLGLRSLAQVFETISWKRRLKIFGRFFSETASLSIPPANMVFPSGSTAEGEYAFFFKRFTSKRVKRFSSYCKQREATLSDLFVAGLFRAVAEETQWKGDSTLRMICTVDLRRYLPEEKAQALCNLSSFFVPNLGCDLGVDLDDTLKKVKAYVDRAKQSDMGLSYMLVDASLGSVTPFFVLRKIMAAVVSRLKASKNFAPALTNLGPVKVELLDFGGFCPAEAEVIVPATGPPFFAIGLSGYKGGLTISAGYYPSAIKEKNVDSLFQRLDQILPS